MDINTFKDKMKTFTTEEEIKDYLSKRIVVSYIPYNTKLAYCEKIIENTYYIKSDDGKKRLHINSPALFLFYTMKILELYTDIDIESKTALAQYDELNEDGYIELLCSYIPEKESKEFKHMLDMVKDDFIENEFQIGNYVSHRIDNISEILGVTLSPVLEKLGDIISNLDDEKISKVLKSLDNSKIIKMITK